MARHLTSAELDAQSDFEESAASICRQVRRLMRKRRLLTHAEAAELAALNARRAELTGETPVPLPETEEDPTDSQPSTPPS